MRLLSHRFSLIINPTEKLLAPENWLRLGNVEVNTKGIRKGMNLPTLQSVVSLQTNACSSGACNYLPSGQTVTLQP